MSTVERVIFWVPVIILMFFVALLAGLYFARFSSISNLQKIALIELPGTDPSNVFYDLHCTTNAMKAMRFFLDKNRKDAAVGALIISNKWSDPERAFDLMLELKDECNDECM